MRVISGKAKGKKLVAPPDARPLTDRVKEALFNILRARVQGADFLDLFAGSGAVGIEALSRGGRLAFFVESNRKAVAIIRENLQKTGLLDQAEVFSMDSIKATQLLARRKARFDVIFIGAPYDSPALEQVLILLGKLNLHKEQGVVIAEHRKQHKICEQYGELKLFRNAKYGETMLSFFSVSLSPSEMGRGKIMEAG
jgi:16S rRNA (guanine(966)-N(2))-methyltransferase RsmD